MLEKDDTCLPVAAWFLYTEDGSAKGRIHRGEQAAIPVVGVRINGNGTWKSAEVLEFTELQATCGMKRFRVVIRILSA